jgi:ABC-type bacteriocin/lantibiotic exporter with double-glycine peptidase domain
MFSHFGETLNGISTIKAFDAQNRFIEQMEDKIDENLTFMFPNSVIFMYNNCDLKFFVNSNFHIFKRWLAVRIEFIGTLISFFAALFAVLSRNAISAGIAGLSISYSLNVK